MAGKPWSEERKAAAAAKRQAAKQAGGARPAAAKRAASTVDSNRIAVESILMTLSVPVMYLGRVDESFLADAFTLQVSAPAVGDAVAQVAKVNPWLDAALSKGAPATPYILLGTTLLTLGAQFAVNHKVNVGPLASSATPRTVMIDEMKARMHAQAQAAEQQARDAEQERQEAQAWQAAQDAADAEQMAQVSPEHVDARDDALVM